MARVSGGRYRNIRDIPEVPDFQNLAEEDDIDRSADEEDDPEDVYEDEPEDIGAAQQMRTVEAFTDFMQIMQDSQLRILETIKEMRPNGSTQTSHQNQDVNAPIGRQDDQTLSRASVDAPQHSAKGDKKSNHQTLVTVEDSQKHDY
ncbi:hypothetical protein COLO4_32159 [Corchorus olitorius]|uniref:Uncharacterized protein n=1 Tax=Corchorus olitorius TaxID=93759 RepID=A0A1R3H0R0_9ROSI|nr:hypothetical protein COLO4_32159 [Corchorus olitorius]